jgi:hypothetical protein
VSTDCGRVRFALPPLQFRGRGLRMPQDLSFALTALRKSTGCAAL